MHVKNYIPPLREYDPEPTVPLAEIQSNYCIAASGDLLTIHVHGPRKQRCTYKFTFPLAGIRSRTFSSACGNARKMLHPRKRRFCNYFGPRPRLRKCTINCVYPRAEIRSGRCISASRICKRMCAVPQAVL